MLQPMAEGNSENSPSTLSHTTRRARVLGRGLRALQGVHLTLRTLREAAGRTQIHAAEASKLDQADVSRLESRPGFDECQVSTLHRYVVALGGQLEPAVSRSRVEILATLPRLQVTDSAISLARAILSKGLLPEKAFPDALHIAIATVHQIEYLLTWNCKHIANVEVLPRIALLCKDLGLTLPIICTPEELLGVENDN